MTAVRLPWRGTAYATGVPTAPVSDTFITWIQPLVTMALLVMALLTVAPLGGAGRGGYGLGLVIACWLLASSRSTPDRFVPGPVRLGLAVVAAVLSGLLFGYDSSSWGVAFAYLSAGHAGVRFREPVALAVAGLGVLVSLAALLTSATAPADTWPWWTALTVGLPVTTGLARQNRARTLRTAHEVVEQTRRATESERQASALAERARVARDIHDVLAHSLSGVSVQLDLADALLEAGRVDQARSSVQAARGLVVDGLVEARRAVQTLRVGALDVAESLDRMVGAGEELRLRGDLSGVPAAVGQAAVRIVQEALTNCRRHAPGAPVVVDVRCADDAVLVDVVNGPGDRPAAGVGSGMGLVGVRERAAELGGACRVGPETGGAYAGGWRVHAVLPVPRL